MWQFRIAWIDDGSEEGGIVIGQPLQPGKAETPRLALVLREKQALRRSRLRFGRVDTHTIVGADHRSRVILVPRSRVVEALFAGLIEELPEPLRERGEIVVDRYGHGEVRLPRSDYASAEQ